MIHTAKNKVATLAYNQSCYTICFGLKGGIGSASRVMEIGGRTFTMGALVQTNFGCVENLRIDGLPVGQAVVDMIREEAEAKAKAMTGQDDIGSIMIVVGVALETTQQIESQMMMRHYKGFLD